MMDFKKMIFELPISYLKKTIEFTVKKFNELQKINQYLSTLPHELYSDV